MTNKYKDLVIQKTKKQIICGLILFCLLLVSCKSNQTIGAKMMGITTDMSYSDFKNKYNLPDGSFQNFFLPDSNWVTGSIIPNNIIQVEECNRKGYMGYSEFQTIGNQKVLLYGFSFREMYIGIWTFFDKRDNAYKEIDYDKNYAFSLNDLIDKMKKEYNEDILSKLNLYSITRWENDSLLKRNIYVLNCWQTPLNKQILGSDSDKFLNSYAIDGTTGETIQISSFNLTDKGVYSAYHTYLIKLGLRTEDDYKPKPVKRPIPPY